MSQRSLELPVAGFTNKELKLSLALSELGIPPRALNAFLNLGIEYLGELVVQNHARFLEIPNFGRTSLAKTQGRLNALGLDFGMEVAPWTAARAKEIRKAHPLAMKKEVAIANGTFSSHQDLASEIDAAAEILAKGRNLEILKAYLGLGGDAPRTLQSVGDDYGLTRERVRQIVARAAKKTPNHWLPFEHLCQFLADAEETAPISESVWRDNFVPRTGSKSLTMEALLKAAELVGVQTRLVEIKDTGGTFLDFPDRVPSIHEILIDFRKTTSFDGCVNIDRMSLRLSGNLEEASIFQRVLDGFNETIWLDVEKQWAASTIPEGNRLGSVITKVFSVCEQLHVTELRQACLRPHRISFAPPTEILKSLAVKVCGHSAEGQTVVRRADFEPFAFGKIEQTFVNCFSDLGSPLSREAIEKYCIDEHGMNDSSFFVYLGYSPVIQRVAPSIYGQVGADIPVGIIADIAAERKKGAVTAHGWDSEGKLWFATKLNRISWKMGMLYLPASVLDFTKGKWTSVLPDGIPAGLVDVGDSGISGLQKPFALQSIENDDVVSLHFDLRTKEVEIRQGSDALFDERPVHLSDVEGTED